MFTLTSRRTAQSFGKDLCAGFWSFPSLRGKAFDRVKRCAIEAPWANRKGGFDELTRLNGAWTCGESRACGPYPRTQSGIYQGRQRDMGFHFPRFRVPTKCRRQTKTDTSWAGNATSRKQVVQAAYQCIAVDCRKPGSRFWSTGGTAGLVSRTLPTPRRFPRALGHARDPLSQGPPTYQAL